MKLQQFSAIVTHKSELSLCGPVDKFWMIIMTYSVGYVFLNIAKIYVNFIIFGAV